MLLKSLDQAQRMPIRPLFLLDSANRIALIDRNYRSQGEHLKPLENKLKELNGIKIKVSGNSKTKAVKIGDNGS